MSLPQQAQEGKPTPGPWTAIDTGRRNSCKVEHRANKIATIWSHPLGNREANARLIAAAPDLLAACEAALKRSDSPYVRGCAICLSEGFSGHATNCPVPALEAALRKARGDEAQL